MEFVSILADCLKKEGLLEQGFDIAEHIELLPMQPGDVETTYADVGPLVKDYGFHPDTSLKDGLAVFAKWYKDYYEAD